MGKLGDKAMPMYAQLGGRGCITICACVSVSSYLVIMCNYDIASSHPYICNNCYL